MHVHGPREVELRLQRVENGGRLERWRSRLAGQFFLIPDVTVTLVKIVSGLPTLIFFRSVDSYNKRDGGALFGI